MKKLMRFSFIGLLHILFVMISIRFTTNERIITGVLINGGLSYVIAYLMTIENKSSFRKFFFHYAVSFNFISLLMAMHVYDGGSIGTFIPYIICLLIVLFIEFSEFKNTLVGYILKWYKPNKSIQGYSKQIERGSYFYYYVQDIHGSIAGIIFLILGVRFFSKINLFPVIFVFYLLGLIFEILSKVLISSPALEFFKNRHSLKGKALWYSYEALNIPYYYQEVPEVYYQDIIETKLNTFRKNNHVINDINLGDIISVFTQDSFIKRHLMAIVSISFIVLLFIYIFIAA